MKPALLFITGTDTGVGKTVFAVLLTQQLRARGVRVAALKPLCSGGRGDARAMHEAGGKVLPLDEVNPWHFRSALAPLLAARLEKKRVRLGEVVAYIRHVAKRFEVVVVEGAGGLLSPLGEDFDSRDLIRALAATPILICPNRLGAVNQVLLVVSALPAATARRTQIVLMSGARRGGASRTNAQLLREILGRGRVHEFPRLSHFPNPGAGFPPRQVHRRLAALLAAAGRPQANSK